MKKNGILNPLVSAAVAALGHTQYVVIGDAGLPAPAGVSTIDLSVSAGIPAFLDVLRAVCGELAVESFVCAAEITERNPGVHSGILQTLPGIPGTFVSHAEFKALTADARCFIRTGECSPYANIILVGGVSF